MGNSTTDLWPRSHAGVQLRRGPSCWAFALINAAIAAGVEGAATMVPDAVFRMACAADGIDDEVNAKWGTTGAAVAKVMRDLVPACVQRVDPSWVVDTLADGHPVAASLRWHYPRTGMIGSTLRRQPGIGDTQHAVALVGFDPRHRTGLFRRRPCLLVLDSRSPSFRRWLPVADFEADALECYEVQPYPTPAQ